MQLLNVCVFMISSQMSVLLLCIPQSPGHRAPPQLRSLEFLRPRVSLGSRSKISLFTLFHYPNSQTVSSMEKHGVLCLLL